MDVRGMYISNPANVSLEEFEPLLQQYPTSAAEYEAWKEASKTVAQSWQNMSQPEGIMQFLGTYEFIRDWDLIRQSLGYDKISILAASYGTYRGMAYVHTFPGHVDRVVFDAVVPIGMVCYPRRSKVEGS